MSGLHKALEDGRYKQFLLLLNLGSDPDTRSAGGLSPLMKCCAVPSGTTACVLVKALLEKGADRDALDKMGRNVLAHAVLRNKLGVIRILLQDDCNINHADKYGNTIYHYVAYLGLAAAAELFLPEIKTYGCHINAYNMDGLTPLMCACTAGNLEVARIFVHKYKAAVRLRDRYTFKSALDWLKSFVPVPEDVDPFDLSFTAEIGNGKRMVKIPLYITRASVGVDLRPRGRRDKVNDKKPRPRCTSAPPAVVANRRNTPIPTIIVVDDDNKSTSFNAAISVDDFGDLRSAEAQLKLMRKRPATSFEMVRQILTDFAGQRTPSYRRPAVAIFHELTDSEPEDDQTVSGRSSQMSHSRCRSPFNAPKKAAADLLLLNNAFPANGKNKALQRKLSKAINLRQNTDPPDSPTSSSSELKSRLKNNIQKRDSTSGNSFSTLFTGMKFASKLNNVRGRGARHSIAITSGLPSLGIH